MFYNSLRRYLLVLYKLVSCWLVSRGRWGIRLGLICKIMNSRRKTN